MSAGLSNAAAENRGSVKFLAKPESSRLLPTQMITSKFYKVLATYLVMFSRPNLI
jgi:hypothetical protein